MKWIKKNLVLSVYWIEKLSFSLNATVKKNTALNWLVFLTVIGV